MKKLVLILLVFGIGSTLSFAQTTKAAHASQSAAKSIVIQSMDGSPTAKGKWLVGPELNFVSLKNEDGNTTNKQSSLWFQPEVGYFIADNLSVGFGIGLGTKKTVVDGVEYNKSSTFTVAPTLRYYLPISTKFQFLGKMRLHIGNENTTMSGGNAVDEKLSLLNVNLSPAFVFFPSNKISIEMTMGSLYYNSQKEGDNSYNTFGLAFLSNDSYEGRPTFGVKWHLGK